MASSDTLDLTIYHPILGAFDYEMFLDWYATSMLWCGHEVELIVSCDKVLRYHQFALAVDLWKYQYQWHKIFLEAIIIEMVEKKKESLHAVHDLDTYRQNLLDALNVKRLFPHGDGRYAMEFSSGNFFRNDIKVQGHIVNGIEDVSFIYA